MPKSKIAAIAWLVTAIYWVALFIATHVPMSGNSPKTRWIRQFDKVEHVVAFTGLALLLCVTGTVLGRRSMLLASVLGMVVLYAGFDEATQLLVPTRQADVLDWVADLLGGGIGVSAFLLLGQPLLAVAGWRGDVA